MAVIAGVSAKLPLVGNDLDSDYFDVDASNLFAVKRFSATLPGLAPSTNGIPSDYVLSAAGKWVLPPSGIDGYEYARMVGIYVNTIIDQVLTISASYNPTNRYIRTYQYPAFISVRADTVKITLPFPPDQASSDALIGELLVVKASGAWVGTVVVNQPLGANKIDGDRSQISFSKTSKTQIPSVCFMWGGDRWYLLTNI